MLVLGLLTGAMLNQDKPIVIVETEHLCYPIQHVEQPLLHAKGHAEGYDEGYYDGFQEGANAPPTEPPATLSPDKPMSR